jgi:hypothetical protein
MFETRLSGILFEPSDRPASSADSERMRSFGPRRLLTAFLNGLFAENLFCKVMHNVIVRPNGIYFADCLDVHYSTARCGGNSFSVVEMDLAKRVF